MWSGLKFTRNIPITKTFFVVWILQTVLLFSCVLFVLHNLVYNALEEINSDINFDTRNEDQATPLHFACKNKTSGVAIHLLQRFPDKIHVLGIHGIHLLHFACRYGHLELVKYIFGNPDFDIDFNIATLGGNTSLHFACYVGHYEVVKFFRVERRGCERSEHPSSFSERSEEKRSVTSILNGYVAFGY